MAWVLRWFLQEHSPREITWGYVAYSIRVIIRTQFNWFFPGAIGLYFGICGILLAAQQDPGLLVVLMAGGAAGGLPALGASAVWRLASARIYPALDAHPQNQDSISMGYRLPVKPGEADDGGPLLALGEHHPIRGYKRGGDYDLTFQTSELYSMTPEWAVVPWRSLVTGLLVLGSIGSGKTAFVLRPGIFRLFHHHSRVGGLVMDTKAALVEPLRAVLEEAGRAEDFLPIGPGQPTVWNPLHMPLLSPAAIAETLVNAIENLNGAAYSSDARWIRNGAANVVEGAVGLLRLRTGYLTALAMRLLLGELMAQTQGSETPGEDTRKFLDNLFRGHSLTPAQQEEFDHYCGLVISRMSEDEKFRAIYVSEILALLVPLTAPGLVGKYNAPLAQLDMPAWSDIINQGKVVVLDANAHAVPGIAVILGTILKLGYQQAMLARLDWARSGLCNMDRFMTLVIDEYQDFVSISDADYLALCRESKSISCFLTQGYASVVQRVGEDKAKVILQSLRNCLVLTQEFPEFAADLLGQAEVEEVDRSIQENIQDASLSAAGRFAGQSSVSESMNVKKSRKHVVPPELLQTLPVGQAILKCHDGMRAVPPHRVFLRPYFAPDQRHADGKK